MKYKRVEIPDKTAFSLPQDVPRFRTAGAAMHRMHKND
jgi:hypothetical protein